VLQGEVRGQESNKFVCCVGILGTTEGCGLDSVTYPNLMKPLCLCPTRPPKEGLTHYLPQPAPLQKTWRPFFTLWPVHFIVSVSQRHMYPVNEMCAPLSVSLHWSPDFFHESCILLKGVDFLLCYGLVVLYHSCFKPNWSLLKRAFGQVVLVLFSSFNHSVLHFCSLIHICAPCLFLTFPITLSDFFLIYFSLTSQVCISSLAPLCSHH
jgi:hypothetical protein